MHVREGQVLLPIELRYVMLSGSYMVSHVMHDGLVYRGHLSCAQPLLAEERIDSAHVGGAQELAFRVGALVSLGARHVKRPGRDQRQQFVAIDGKIFGMPGVLLIVRAEPVGEGGIEMLDGFAVAALQ